MMSGMDSNSGNQKKIPNPSNFKIVKCKNYDKGKSVLTLGNCKYGSTCTFAHGDVELRTKVDNMMQSSSPMNMPPYMMDPNFLMYMNSMGMGNMQMNPNGEFMI